MRKVVPDTALLIPESAKKVFAGQIFDVYQWLQTMFDGSTETFEMLKRPDTVQVIAVKDNQIVLVHDEQPGRSARLHFPGGRADEDDSWLAAAQRELKEETGMSFKTWRLIDVQQPVPKIEWFVPWFLATDFDNQTEQQLDSGEKIEVIVKDFSAIHKLILDEHEPTMTYAIPLFRRLASLEELLKLPEYAGQTVDR